MSLKWLYRILPDALALLRAWYERKYGDRAQKARAKAEWQKRMNALRKQARRLEDAHKKAVLARDPRAGVLWHRWLSVSREIGRETAAGKRAGYIR